MKRAYVDDDIARSIVSDFNYLFFAKKGSLSEEEYEWLISRIFNTLCWSSRPNKVTNEYVAELEAKLAKIKEIL